MFDVTHHHHESRISSSVHVTEKRAPTDESVRLLAEMEAAAAARVKAAIRVTDTAFECVIHAARDHLNDRMLIAAVFSLNGRKMEAKTFFQQGDTETGIEKLVKEVALVIACEVLRGCMTPTLLRELRA